MTVISTQPNKRDRNQVEVLAGMGASEDFISSHLHLTVAELNTYYSKELTSGAAEANLQVAKTFHELATSGEHPQMTLAWMKMRAGWSDAAQKEEEGYDDDSASLAKDKLLKLLNRGK